METPGIGCTVIETPETRMSVSARKNEDQQRRVCAALRQLQSETRCSTALLGKIVGAMAPFLPKRYIPHNVMMADKGFHAEAGAECFQLFVCENCENRKVWKLEDVPDLCPHCSQCTSCK